MDAPPCYGVSKNAQRNASANGTISPPVGGPPRRDWAFVPASQCATIAARMSSAEQQRESPKVPNHDLMKIIGRGSYGEIWLARSLTGTLRAVKIVHRSTFDSE